MLCEISAQLGAQYLSGDIGYERREKSSREYQGFIKRL